MSQSLSQLWVHIIFSTKKRYPFLTDVSVREQLYTFMNGTCSKLNCPLIAVGGIEDHVHLLVGLHKNISVAFLVEKLKKTSSKWIKTLAHNGLNKFYWQNGYGAFSVSQSSLDAVKKYVNNQEKHHQHQNFQDELRRFLTRYNVNFKEEYVWD